MKRLFILFAAGVVAAVVPAFAHHAFAAEFDSTKPITLTGAVAKVDWENPHARFFMIVKEESGEVKTWEVELASPIGLVRRGMTKNSIKVGDIITVNGFLAKDGSNLVNSRFLTLADGQVAFTGTTGYGGPPGGPRYGGPTQ